ncbi:TIGR01177 family methyltransferase [Methanobrevibacter sp. TMH8]|uniref:DNA methyltransferase n=1 Tax=Methanobrevibacter sp. TMH8 TaxID=2848611 RepID=UPI001CCD6C97|nr:DNA methyltransferase [Methanobrevibacter sp. TMH8]MBZ9571312.1 TIGR01177 family methyltransferase [Methanobrevibacter sp. TMH8]
MDLLLIQSQEHETLPLAELKAVLATEKIDCNIEIVTNGLVLLKSLNKEDFYKNYKLLVRRLAYTHEIHELILRTDSSHLEDQFKDIKWDNYISDDFVVRIKRFDKVEIDTPIMERQLGHLILNYNIGENNQNNQNNENNENYENYESPTTENHFKVNLKDPNSFIRVLATKNEIFVAYEKFKLNKKHFQKIKPHKRPFFYPGSMSPKLARCMVNLSHIKEGQLMLDPFCGTGGILIEGGMIGAKLIGSDINWNMKNGTIVNLEYCSNLDYCDMEESDYEAHHIDVRELKLYEKVDAVVTDPPYGISTSTGGVKDGKIFHQFLESIDYNMKENAYLCIAHPHYLDIDPMLEDLDFELLERHRIKMHKSLTRIISVIRKIK